MTPSYLTLEDESKSLSKTMFPDLVEPWTLPPQLIHKTPSFTTLASTFGYELADMYLHIVTEELKQM